MPYCTKCGAEVQDIDTFCSRCGTRQTAAPPHPQPPPQTKDLFENIPANKASVLCYIPFMGWIAAIIVLASPRFRHDRIVRFHAFQGLYLFVAWLIIHWTFGWMWGPMGGRMPFIPMLQAGLLFVWIFMIIKTKKGIVFSLPIIGELAERSLSEW